VNLRKHHDRACRWCDTRLWYGVKEESTGWKVFYVCHTADGCGREWYAGRIERKSIKNYDDVFDEAKALSPIQ
jgi:hypothetical protein